MAKQPKKIQTDYTKGGRDISNTAIPLYQKNLTRMDEYLENPQARLNQYLQDYFTNTAAENDLLRQYKRDMGTMTANNYAATGGGYSSLNQMNYDDQQRYYNDLASRLQQAGVGTAYNMATGDYQNMLAANPAYQTAYQQGKEYSDIQQYNNLVDQYNSTAWMQPFSGVLGAVGQGLSVVPGMQVVGGALQAGAGALGNAGYSLPSEISRGVSQGVSQGAYGTAGTALGAGFTDLYNNGSFNWLLPKRLEKTSGK